MNHMRQVTRNVWLGSVDDAQDRERLSRLGIRAILNVSHEHNTPTHKDIVLFKVGIVEDSRKSNPIFEAVELLDTLVTKYGSVLVHCHAGVNRSPFIVTLWLVTKLGMSFDEAVDWTRVGLCDWMDQWIDQSAGIVVGG